MVISLEWVASLSTTFHQTTALNSHGNTSLTTNMLRILAEDRGFEIPVTEEEIEDKSKGDFLSKAIAFVQVSWFITQCVARFVQGLGVTELEVATLALASMNGVMYAFWWQKPLAVRVPVTVQYRGSTAYHWEDRGQLGVSLKSSFTIPLINRSYRTCSKKCCR